MKCGVVLVAVLAGFVAHSAIHLEPSLVALLGAGILIVISGLDHSDYLSGVEWDTLLFFAGLFVMVGALVKTGVVKDLARLATEATGGHALLTTMFILVLSLLLSGLINNVPYAATMAPVVGQLLSSMAGHVHPQVLWWALTLGTDLGGNLTAVGASANVVILGIAKRADSPISFWEFTRKGMVVTAVSAALSLKAWRAPEHVLLSTASIPPAWKLPSVNCVRLVTVPRAQLSTSPTRVRSSGRSSAWTEKASPSTSWSTTRASRSASRSWSFQPPTGAR